jgi:mRNA interferase RelE/StbE
MTYTIITPKTVQKQLDDLPNEVCDRVADKIQQLAEDPRPDGVVKLKGFDNEYVFASVIIAFAMKFMMKN